MQPTLHPPPGKVRKSENGSGYPESEEEEVQHGVNMVVGEDDTGGLCPRPPVPVDAEVEGLRKRAELNENAGRLCVECVI